MGKGIYIFENLAKICLCNQRFALEKFAFVRRKSCSWANRQGLPMLRAAAKGRAWKRPESVSFDRKRAQENDEHRMPKIMMP